MSRNKTAFRTPKDIDFIVETIHGLRYSYYRPSPKPARLMEGVVKTQSERLRARRNAR